MRKHLLLLMIIAALTALVTASTTQAAPVSITADFGILMKPGWGGTNGTVSDGNIALVKCVLQHTNTRRSYMPSATYVYSNAQKISCAKMPLAYWAWKPGVTYNPNWALPGYPISDAEMNGLMGLFSWP